ncbi:MAG: thiol reductant ABC exporter subunit CydC [Propionibacteriaceae bacterium]|jgi:thiol reductant ABC exporter CydC subunit|nr:thiol reductant ABC exporter subunit CydC [Propionibacteriaceae bacterium]
MSATPAAVLSPAALRRRLVSLARPVLPPLALSLLCRLGQLGAGLALFGVAGWAVGRAVDGPAWAVAPVVWTLVGLSLLKGALRYGEQFCGHLVAFKALARLRVYFYDRLEPQAPAAVAGRPSGDLLARVTKDVDRVEVFFAHTLVPAAAAVLVPVATTVAFGALVGWPGALILALALAVVGLVTPRLGARASAGAATALRAGRGALAQHVTDSVQGVREVLGFGAAGRRLAELAELEQPVAAGLATLGRWAARRRGLNTLVVTLALVAEAAWLTAPAAGPGPGLATTGLGLGLTVAAFGPVLAVEDFAADLQQAYASARRLFEVTDAAPLVTDPGTADAGAAPERPEGWRATAALVAPDVEFDHVTFTYPDLAGGPGRTRPALAGLTFTARGGAVTALVGASWSGKSTVAALLARAFDPDAGAIRLGGVDLRDYALDQLRAEVGLAPQRPYLFNDTLAGNLRLAAPSASAAELAAAARQAGLDDVVAAEPEGWAAPVGEQGERLSGGQRQRLALARTLVARPSVVVLDEVTSQVDAATEQRVLAGMREATAGKTVLFIAHRLATVRDADWIVVLDNGSVVQQGVYADLATAAGPFRDLLDREA